MRGGVRKQVRVETSAFAATCAAPRRASASTISTEMAAKTAVRPATRLSDPGRRTGHCRVHLTLAGRCLPVAGRALGSDALPSVTAALDPALPHQARCMVVRLTLRLWPQARMRAIRGSVTTNAARASADSTTRRQCTTARPEVPRADQTTTMSANAIS